MKGPPQSLTEYLSQEAIQFSSRVVKHLRLSSHFRIADGAVFCKVLLRFCNQAFKHTQIWTFIDWISCPVCGTNKIRIEYCLDETIEIQRMKAFQGRSRVQSIDPRLQKNVFMPQGWVNGRSLRSKVITEDLRKDLLDAHHVYGFPEVLRIIAKPLANHSQLLLESLHACKHV